MTKGQYGIVEYNSVLCNTIEPSTAVYNDDRWKYTLLLFVLQRKLLYCTIIVTGNKWAGRVIQYNSMSYNNISYKRVIINSYLGPNFLCIIPNFRL